MFRVSVLVALVCLSAPSIGRSWGGSDDYDYKAWVAEREEIWKGIEDYEDDDYRGHGYGNHKFDHFRYHHNHGGHNFDHHDHGDYEYHHQGINYQGHGRHNDHDKKHDYHGHHSRPESTVPNSSISPQSNKGIARNNLRPTPMQNTGFKPKPVFPQNNQNRDQFQRNNADRVFFPDNQTPNLSTTRSPPAPVPSSTTPEVTQPPATSTTISSLVLQDVLRCIRDCPVTPEFNPVCGTNNVTYNNLGELECTRNCGVNVALSRRAPCPQPLPPAFFISVPMPSTERPIVNARAGENKDSAPIAKSSSENAAQTAWPPRTV